MSQFTVNTKVLQSVVNKAIKGASNSKFSAITSLMNVIVSGGRINVTTTDCNNYLTISDSIIGGDDCDFTVSVDLFSKIVLKTSVDNIKINVSDDEISFHGNGTYKIPIQLDVDGSPIKYPKHEINNADYTGTIKTSVIKNIIFHNKPSLAVTMEAPYLTGYLCNVHNVISADTFNICSNEVSTFSNNLLVPPIVFELLSMSSEEDIEYKVLDKTVIFATKDMKLYSVMQDGIEDYPVDQISAICESKYSSNCVLPKTALLNIIERLSIFISDNDQNGLYFTFTDKGVTIESMNGNGVETLPYQGSENFQNYSCCIGVESLKKQVSAHLGESIKMYYGNEKMIMIRDENVTQIVSLLDDPRTVSE